MTAGGFPSPPKVAEHLLAEVIAHDDAHGALANARGDELRDALRLAAERLRIYEDGAPRAAFMVGARRLVAEVWWLVQEHAIDSRSRAADAALDLRDQIDPNWWPDPRVEGQR